MKRRQLAPSDPENTLAWAQRMRKRLTDIHLQQQRLDKERHEIVNALWGLPKPVFEETFASEILCPWSHAPAEAETQWAELHGFLAPTKKEREEGEERGIKKTGSEKNSRSQGDTMLPESCSGGTGQGTGHSGNVGTVEEGVKKDDQRNVHNVVQGNGPEGARAASGDTGISGEGGVNHPSSSSSSSPTEPHSHGLKSLPTCDDDKAAAATLIRPHDYDKNCHMNDQPTGGYSPNPPEPSPTASDRSENATCPTILTPSSLRERLESRRVKRTASTLTSIGSDVDADVGADASKRQRISLLNGSRSFRCVEDDLSLLERGMCKARVISSKEGDNDGEKDLVADNRDGGMTGSMENKPQHIKQPQHINTACDSSSLIDKDNNNNNNNNIFPEYPLGGNENRDIPPIVFDAQGTIRLPSIGSPNHYCGMENNEKITNYHDDENVQSIPKCGEPFKKEKEIDLKKTHDAEHGGTTMQVNGIVDEGLGRKRPSFHTKKTVRDESAHAGSESDHCPAVVTANRSHDFRMTEDDAGGKQVVRSGVASTGLQHAPSTSRKTLSPRHHDHYQMQQQQQQHTSSSSTSAKIPGKVRRKSGPVKGGAASLLATNFKNATAGAAAAYEEEEIDLTDAPTYPAIVSPRTTFETVQHTKPASPRSPFVGENDDNDDTISQELDFLTQVPSTFESEHEDRSCWNASSIPGHLKQSRVEEEVRRYTKGSGSPKGVTKKKENDDDDDDDVDKEQRRRSLARTLIDEGEVRTPKSDVDENDGEVEQKSHVNAENPIAVHRDRRSSRVSIASTLIDPSEARELRDGEIHPNEYEQERPPIIQHSSRVSVATTLVCTQSPGVKQQPYDCLTNKQTCNLNEGRIEGDLLVHSTSTPGSQSRLPKNLESPYINTTRRRTSDYANCKVDDDDDDPSLMGRSDAVMMSLRHSTSGHTTEQRVVKNVVVEKQKKENHLDNNDKEDSESSELVPLSLETEERTPKNRVMSTPPGMRHQVKDEGIVTSESKRRRTRSPIMTISDEEGECAVNDDTKKRPKKAAARRTSSRSPSNTELKLREESTIRALRTPSRERENKLDDKNSQNNSLHDRNQGMDRPRFRLSRSSTSPLVSRDSMVNGVGAGGDAKRIVTDRKNVISIDLSSSSDEDKEKPASKKKHVASGKPAPAARVSAPAAGPGAVSGAPASAPDVRMPMRGKTAPSIASQDALHHPITQSAPSSKPPPSKRSSQGNLVGTCADSNSRLAVDRQRPPVVQARKSVAMAPMPIESTAFGRLPYEFFASLSSAGMKDYLRYFGMKVTCTSEKEQRKQLYDNIKYLTDGVMPESLVPLPDRVDEKQLEEEREIIQAIRRTPHFVQMLTFDPVDLYDLQAHLKEGGVRIDLNSLRLLLESKGVTIRLQGKDDRRY